MSINRANRSTYSILRSFAPMYQRKEALRCVCQIPQRRSGATSIPVNEDPTVTITHKVPWGQIVMANHRLRIRADGDLPLSCGWRFKALRRVVEVSDKTTNLIQILFGKEIGPIHRRSGYIFQNVASLFIASKSTRRSCEALPVKVLQKRFDTTRC